MDKDMDKDNDRLQTEFIPIQLSAKKLNEHDESNGESVQFADELIELKWKEDYLKTKKI